MSHNDHSSNEKKPVAFTVPFILASVTVLIILMFLSLCDPKAGHEACCEKEECSKECMEACEKGDHSKHPAKHGHGDMVMEGCTEECKESCAKGDHSKHGKHHEQHEAVSAETAAPVSDSAANTTQEPAPAH